MRGAGPSPCPIDHTRYTCQLILDQFWFALWVQKSCKKNLCNSTCESMGNNGSSWDFRCLNQTQRDTVAKQPQGDCSEQWSQYKECRLSLPTALVWRSGQNRTSKNTSGWLIGSGSIIHSKYITCDQQKDLGEQRARSPNSLTPS